MLAWVRVITRTRRYGLGEEVQCKAILRRAESERRETALLRPPPPLPRPPPPPPALFPRRHSQVVLTDPRVTRQNPQGPTNAR
jgi:hypothetical protein